MMNRVVRDAVLKNGLTSLPPGKHLTTTPDLTKAGGTRMCSMHRSTPKLLVQLERSRTNQSLRQETC
jgi:hypothetical protein